MKDINFLRTIFDIVRVINPVKKESITESDYSQFFYMPYNHCFEVWKKSKACENCIGIEAVKHNETKVKIEETMGRVFLVIAAPYEREGKTYALEMVKDVTGNDFVNILGKSSDMDYQNLISNLNRAVITDELTQIYNKRYILEAFPYQLKQASFGKRTMAVVIADIDHFKIINDEYGHPVGDIVLKKIAEILKREVRGTSDWVARSGGEEFMFIFNDIDIEILESVCNRIRKKVEAAVFEIENSRIEITISMGGTLIQPNNIQDAEAYIAHADQLLYRAKRSGRNCCCISEFE